MFTMSSDIIVLGFIAGFILYRLYLILGQKDSDGDVSEIPKRNNISGIIDISAMVKTTPEETSPLSETEINLTSGFEKVMTKVRTIEEGFSLEKFLNGAKNAFEIILVSFADNDRKTLESLLDKKTYKQFISEIDGRAKNKVTLNITLVSLPIVEIKNITLKGKNISIDVFYQSQQITLLKDQKGKIIEGDVSQVDDVKDTWTFNKELNSGNSWRLVKVTDS